MTDRPPARFDDEGRYLHEFSGRVDVRCPRCGERATATRGDEAAPARVICGSCPYAVSFDETGWLGPMRGEVRRRCGRCGRWVERRFGGPRPPRAARLECECGWQFDEDVTMSRQVDGPVDPTFGLELWLTAPFRGEVVWAYDVEHLRFLRDLVGADLRQRTPNRNSSLASRLPGWMKAAKNRDALLSVFEDLEHRASTT